MKFIELPLNGVFLIEVDSYADDRGLFARTFCVEEFSAQHLNTNFPQSSTSYNKFRGTVRGLHYQSPPYEEKKLIRCTRGAMFDVIVDVKKTSSTYLKWTAVELTADNRKSIYVPEGFAHGFQTLQDDTEVLYQISVPYHADAVAGLRWSDPAIGIQWPLDVSIISERDRALPLIRR